MSMGIACQDATGTKLTMFSPSMNGAFYRGGSNFSVSSTIQDSTFSGKFAIATPQSVASIVFNSMSGGFGNTAFNIAGYVPSGGTSYSQPAITRTGNTGYSYPASIWQNFVSISSTLTSYVHYFGVPPQSGGYGIKAIGSTSSSVAIDKQYKSLYVQPKANGDHVRSAVANSMPSSQSTDFSAKMASFTQPVSQNVFFDKAYTNPPLIFITASDGYIAMNYMIRDGNGKYIGASITAISSFANLGNPHGVAPYTANSFNFSYFIISEEKPSYTQSSNYGMRVFDTSGNEVFNSSYYVPSFQALSVPTPNLQLYTNSNTSTQYQQVNSNSFNMPPGYGICINNFQSITGICRYSTQGQDTGGGYVWFGPSTINGRFVSVSGNQAYIIGGGSCAISSGYWAGGNLYCDGFSVDASGNPSGNIDVLFANHSY